MTKSAESFKRSETHVLPKSELEVELRKPDAGRLLAQKAKSVPQLLTPMVMDLIEGKVSQDAFNEQITTSTVDNMAFMTAFQDIIVAAAFVWPVVVDKNPNYAAGEIVIEDLQPEDRAWVFQWALPQEAELASAQTFRIQPGQPVATAPNGKKLRPTSERSVRN